MELRDIEYFAVVAEHRHLGRAAEALGLSATALSKSLRRLEASVQAKLVRRTSKGVELTSEGGLLLSRVRGLRLSLQEISREIADLSQGRSGSLRVGTLPGVIDDLVAPVSSTLFMEGARVTLNVFVGNNDTLLPALQNGELDFVISATPKAQYEDLVHEHLFDDELVVFASAKHPLTRKKRVTVAELAEEQWSTPAASTPGSMLWLPLSAHGLRNPRFVLFTASLSLRDHVIASTRMLGHSSRRVLRNIAQRLDLAEVPVPELQMTRPVCISYRKGAYLSPLARRMIELLKNVAKKIAV